MGTNIYPVPLGHLTDTQIENMAKATDNELALEILRRHEEAAAELESMETEINGHDDALCEAKREGEEDKYEEAHDEIMPFARHISEAIEELEGELRHGMSKEDIGIRLSEIRKQIESDRDDMLKRIKP